MNVFMIYVRDEDYYRMLPQELGGSGPDDERVKVMAFPPLGIETLAPVLRQHGHRVRMFDTCHPKMKADHIVQAVNAESPDVIALSFLSTTTYPSTKIMAGRLKEAAPQTPVILGGVFASMNAEFILKDCPHADCVGVGEGEELLPDYLDHLADPGAVAGLVWRNGDKVIRNEPRPLIRDLDQFPYPDRDSLPIDYIESLPLDVPAVLSLDKFCTIQTSRGCPYGCIYCDIPSLSEGKWRHRSANMFWEKCSSSTMRVTARFILPMITFCSSARASAKSAMALSTADSNLPGVARAEWIRRLSTNCRS